MAQDENALSEDVAPLVPLPDDAASTGRLRVRGARHDVPVRRVWATGFSVALADADRVGGRVDLYDGARFLCRALVVASDDHGDERRFEFKYATRAVTTPPRPDYAPEEAPAEADVTCEAVRGARPAPLPQG